MKDYLKPEIAFLSFETEAITTGGMDGNTSVEDGNIPGMGGI